VPPTLVGYLEGRMTIGPLRPAQRVDEPASPVPPEVYTAYPVKIFKSDGATWVADVRVHAAVRRSNPLRADSRSVYDEGDRTKIAEPVSQVLRVSPSLDQHKPERIGASR